MKTRGRTYSDCAILYRTNAQSRSIEEVLVRSNIPYTIVGGTRFYERMEIKDVLAYLKLINNGDDNQSFNRIINVPKRGLGKTTLDKLEAFADSLGIGMLEASSRANQIAEIPPKTARLIMDFAEQVKRWQAVSGDVSVSFLLDRVLLETKYLEKLEEEAKEKRRADIRSHR